MFICIMLHLKTIAAVSTIIFYIKIQFILFSFVSSSGCFSVHNYIPYRKEVRGVHLKREWEVWWVISSVFAIAVSCCVRPSSKSRTLRECCGLGFFDQQFSALLL